MMRARASSAAGRGQPPATRLGFALLASLVLHALWLIPVSWWLPHAESPRTLPLSVRLPPQTPSLDTTSLRDAQAVPPREAPPPRLAPPTPRREAREAVSRELTFESPPRALRGRALEAAMTALAREEFYPRAAIERGLEGRVVLLLSLDASGRVIGVDVASSSGHALLDEAAVRAAARIGRLDVSRRQVLLPVDFRLE